MTQPPITPMAVRVLCCMVLLFSHVAGRATLLREYWLNIQGALVSDLTSNTNYPDNPSGSNQLATFEAPINWADYYGTRIRGYITPAISGPYIFWISSDDASELWLSPSDDPEAKVLIASVPGWTNSREWTKYPSQQSTTITLVAGQQYYVEALHKENAGGDNVAVGWAKPGDPATVPFEVIPGTVLSPWTGPKPGYNSRPVITVPSEKWFAEAPVTVQLTATVKDDGNPLPANPGNPDPNDTNKLRWSWSLISRPAASTGVVWQGHPTNGEAFTYSGSPNTPGTIFTCDPTAALDGPGLYQFQFTANDGGKQTSNTVKVFIRSTGVYRTLGYSYLSPVPGAEYCSPQTRIILVRFKDVAPTSITNLAQCIQVTGARSGVHAGTAKIAGDAHTLMFRMSTDFLVNELVTVNLNPGVANGAGGSALPYQYTFMVSGHLPDMSTGSGGDTTDPPTGTITARGDNPPNETRLQAFDDSLATKWLDFSVPDGTSNFSWIQYLYPGSASNVVNRYTIASANDAPERDPADWNFYGVDALGGLTLLDRQTNQVFADRYQVNSYPFENTTAYHGYQLEISRVFNPATSIAVQLSELEFLQAEAPTTHYVRDIPISIGQPPAVTQHTSVPTNNAGGPITASAITMPNGVSVPADFPFITITTNNNPDPDYIFIDNRGGNGHPYNVIFDNTGSPIWYSRYPDERRDMKVQPNGLLTMLARDGGNHYNALNTNYQQVAAYWGTNGYGVDEHELQMLRDGTYFLVALRSENVDMSRYISGGNPAASVTEQVIQQFAPNGDLIFQWRAWDNFNILDQSAFIDITSSSFDFPHMNAIDMDTDGQILLSSRSISEITKIDHETGQIIWRLGGNENQYNFVNDPLQGPRNQHAIRSVGTNHYTLFDNGDLHNPSVSRGVEYLLDPTNKTATIVWQYPGTTTTALYSFYMGDVQRLTNGNTLIDWAVGNLPKLTEVRPDGSKAFEMNWVSQFEAYRTWRCAWHGVALQPYLILEPYPDNLTLIFNQFGDTNVAYYRIYGGPTPHPTTLLATSASTLKSLSNLTNGLYYFRVTAMSKSGVEGPYSNETNVNVNIISPGQNMVANGDFTSGTNSWSFTLSGGATGAWRIENGASHFDITNGGTTLPNVQFLQTGKAIVQGKKYVLEFDAWSDATRYIDVKVAQSNSPFADYSKITSPFLTPTRTHFRYVFTMQQPTDFSANLLFNLGASTADVFLDNVSLYNPPIDDLNLDARANYLDLGVFSSGWLKQQSGLPGDLDGNNKVDFKDFGIFGDNWPTGIP
jgi:hypothetical protein